MSTCGQPSRMASSLRLADRSDESGDQTGVLLFPVRIALQLLGKLAGANGGQPSAASYLISDDDHRRAPLRIDPDQELRICFGGREPRVRAGRRAQAIGHRQGTLMATLRGRSVP